MLETWKIIAITTPIFFVLYQALSKLLPKNISVFLINAYASLTGFLIMLLIHLLTSSDKSLALNNKSLLLAVSIGILISVGNFFIIKAYTLGAAQSVFVSLYYPALIGYSVLFGLLIWHEKLTPVQILGLVLSVIGIILVAFFKK